MHPFLGDCESITNKQLLPHNTKHVKQYCLHS